MQTKSRAMPLIAAGAMSALALPALAREPGVPTNVPAGSTVGVPIAAQLPPGLYFSSRSGYSSERDYDADGNYTGAKVTIKDSAAQFLWIPELKIFGAQYRAFFTLPLLSLDLDVGGGAFEADNTGLSSMEIRPIDLSWEIAPGIFTNAGISFHTPSDWDASEGINTGGEFWAISPSVGISYLRDGWNLSLHGLYFTNTRNTETDYKSGDEILVNATVTKDIGGFQVGPVAYWRRQITDDSNEGSFYGGTIAGRANRAGIGLSVTKRFGPVEMNVAYTHDVVHENTTAGNRLWLNFGIPLGGR